MKLTFLGAAHEVTGSCHLLEACGKKLIIDCGLQQGEDEYDNQTLPVVPGELDFVLLTHAHIDHSGRLPLLSKYGFHGQVITTGATTELCGIMLRDSAHIQEFEAEWKNRKGMRAGKDLIEPLYTMMDAEDILGMFSPCRYGETVELCEGIEVSFVDVGHLLGSASIEVRV
ncbi:MAG: MBL fold metallo-hydrolase, partial [Angelakisella sp.]